MKQHKWHKEIKAWADGAEIQYRDGYVWHDINGSIDWGDYYLEYRIKPQPKEPQYLYVYSNGSILLDEFILRNEGSSHCHVENPIGKIKIEVDE